MWNILWPMQKGTSISSHFTLHKPSNQNCSMDETERSPLTANWKLFQFRASMTNQSKSGYFILSESIIWLYLLHQAGEPPPWTNSRNHSWLRVKMCLQATSISLNSLTLIWLWLCNQSIWSSYSKMIYWLIKPPINTLTKRGRKYLHPQFQLAVSSYNILKIKSLIESSI